MAIHDKNNATNPDFWSNLAAENIYYAFDKRVKSVEALRATILWVFGIFSLGGFMLNLFGDLTKFNCNAPYSFGLAFFLLTLAYSLTGKAQHPVVNTNKLGETAGILDTYNHAVEKQSRLFQWAAILTSIGFFFLAVGILIQFDTVKTMKVASSSYPVRIFIKSGVERKGDSIHIPVTVHAKKNEAVSLSYTILARTKKATTDDKPRPNENLFTKVFYTDTTGALYYSHLFLSTDSVKTVIVRASIMEKGELILPLNKRQA